MSYLLDGDDFLEHAAAVTGGAPLTMACWFKPANVTTSGVMMNLGRSGTGDHRFALSAMGTVGGDPVRAETRTTAAASADTTSGFASGVWQHAAAKFAASDNRSAFLNGGSVWTNTSNVVPSSLTRTRLGSTGAGTLPYVGRIAEAAIWGGTLPTDLELIDLAAGVLPTDIQPGSLLAYWPLRDDPLDVVGAFDLSVFGAALDADHPDVGDGGTGHDQDVNDSAAATDQRATAVGAVRADQVDAADARAHTVDKAHNDAAQVADSAVTSTAYRRAIADAVQGGDQVSTGGATAWTLSIADELSASDQHDRAWQPTYIDYTGALTLAIDPVERTLLLDPRARTLALDPNERGLLINPAVERTIALDPAARDLTLDAGTERALALDAREKTLELTETSRTLEVDS